MYLVYSKAIKDSLPITTTSIGSKPCKDPTLISSDPSFYPLEIGRTSKCYDLDPHFTQLIEVGTEFDIQEEYGVIEELDSLLYNERYINYVQKMKVTWSMWSRPTMNLKRDGGCSMIG